jgi:hypothetical protein
MAFFARSIAPQTPPTSRHPARALDQSVAGGLLFGCFACLLLEKDSSFAQDGNNLPIELRGAASIGCRIN